MKRVKNRTFAPISLELDNCVKIAIFSVVSAKSASVEINADNLNVGVDVSYFSRNILADKSEASIHPIWNNIVSLCLVCARRFVFRQIRLNHRLLLLLDAQFGRGRLLGQWSQLFLCYAALLLGGAFGAGLLVGRHLLVVIRLRLFSRRLALSLSLSFDAPAHLTGLLVLRDLLLADAGWGAETAVLGELLLVALGLALRGSGVQLLAGNILDRLADDPRPRAGIVKLLRVLELDLRLVEHLLRPLRADLPNDVACKGVGRLVAHPESAAAHLLREVSRRAKKLLARVDVLADLRHERVDLLLREPVARRKLVELQHLGVRQVLGPAFADGLVDVLPRLLDVRHVFSSILRDVVLDLAERLHRAVDGQKLQRGLDGLDGVRRLDEPVAEGLAALAVRHVEADNLVSKLCEA